MLYFFLLHLGQQSPVSSEAATTARASSVIGNGVHTLSRNNGTIDRNLLNHNELPVTNPLYQRYLLNSE